MNRISLGPRERPEPSKPEREEEQEDSIPETPPDRGLGDKAYPAILPPEPWPDPENDKGK